MVRLRKGFFCCVFTVFALLVVSAGSAVAQQVFGSILGTVTDPSGSAVNNAKVTITDITKGTSSEVMTNESGQYTKGQLIPDTYRVTIEAPGFQKVVSSDLTVQIDQSTQFNAAMQVGNVNQEVEVTAAAPLLQTDRADVSQTFTSQQISELPSIGRNLQAFELLNPGTVKTGWAHASDEDPQGSVQTVVNGLPFYMTGYYLDGTVNQDPILGIIVVNPTFDSVNEVKQSNQDYDAEFDSFAAGLFTYSTKSGTNSFHGDAFEYAEINTPGFQDFARNPFVENTPIAAGAYTPTTHFNQFGGSIGGKIIKDKLFYFGDAQLTRKLLGGSALVSVPTAADRTGDLSDWLAQGPQYQIYCPQPGNTPAGATALQASHAGMLDPNNQLSFCGPLSPQAQAILNYFPAPNTGGGLPYNNYSGNGTLSNNGNQWNTRWDYYLNEKSTFFGRYSYAGFTEQAPGVFGNLAGGIDFNNANYAGSSQALNQSASAGWTYTKSATTINEFRFGYVRYHVTDVPNGYGSTPAAQAGIPGLNTSAVTSGLPTFAIQNPLGAEEDLGYSLHNNQCNCPLTEFERQLQFVDNISHVSGKHSLKFGGDVRYASNLRVPSDSHRAGELYFTGNTTALLNKDGSTSDGLALAGFLLGDVSSFNRYVSSSLDAEERQKRLFWYAQDEWRPTPKLTITYGLRWEMVFPETVNAPANGAELNVNTGLIDVFGVGQNSSHGFQNMNWHEFAPRFGIAYQLGSKTVVRAGYGWTYSLGTFGSTFGHNVTQNPPVLVNQTLSSQSVAGNNFADVFTLAQGPPAYVPSNFPVQPNGTIVPPQTGVYIKTRPGIFTMPVAYAYNLTVQRQVAAKVAVTAGYVGNSTRHSSLGTGNDYDENPVYFLPGYTGNQNLLRPFDGLYGPRYDYGWAEGVDCYCNDANSQYNSFQATLTVKDLAGYTLQGNYTYQVEKGDGYGPAANYTFLYDRPLGYGDSSLMPHQQYVLANNYNIPFGKGRHFGTNSNRFVDAVFGGWNLGAIFTYYTGIPFMPNIGSYPAGTGQPYTGPNSVPDVGSGSPYTSTQNRYTWIVTESQAQLIAGTGPYKLPAANTFGNYPVNTLIGPQFVNVDANIAKIFSLTERFKFQLRLDSTNALNHTNLGGPSNNVTGGTAEQITNIAFNGNGYTMRRLQYSGTLTW
ncbi:MAG: carboxypeptidase regulatory-like domain-containing protein [Bryobacteraceae bacterium]